jgi:heme exporter protein C
MANKDSLFNGIAWWKWLCMALLLGVCVAGFIGPVPRLPILNETIRNLYFHVTMWFGMTILLLTSAGYAIAYLAKPTVKKDLIFTEYTHMAIIFGLIGLITGSVWARVTWDAWWVWEDPKLRYVPAGMLIYLAFLVLRLAIDEPQQRARVAAVFVIFALPSFLSLIYVLPRMSPESLHPGNGGNPGFNSYDLNSQMRPIFYGGVLAFTLLGFWMASLRIRWRYLTYQRIEHASLENEL